jgi:glycerol-3-phosphate cytidylyltransferase
MDSKKWVIGVIAGNFDVIHPGYIKMFKECKANCDKFIVLLHADPTIERPEKLKPILSVEERREILFALDIDTVISYETENELYWILKDGNYDVRFLGDDYIGKPFTGDDLDIPIHYLNRDHGWSTTKIKDLITIQTLKQNPEILKQIEL